MDGNIIAILIAIALVVIAWKVFKGVVKTIVLVVIAIAAAIFVFGGIG